MDDNTRLDISEERPVRNGPNFFERANYYIRNTEASMVNFFSAVAPWGAPIAPAYTSYAHMTDSLGYPWTIALVVAIVVEILGFSAINTIISFWAFNKRANKGRLAEYKRAPVLLAVGSFMGYLLVVMTINIVLDAAGVLKAHSTVSLLDAFSVLTIEEWVKVAGRGLLIMLSIPAGIILAIRTQHKETLDEADQMARAPVSRREQPDKATISKAKRAFITDLRSGRLSNTLAENGKAVNSDSVSELYGVSVRTAYRWLEEYKEA